jgi:hypothetical protein
MNIDRLIKKVIRETLEGDRKVSYEKRQELVSDVVDRIIEHGYDYADELEALNSKFELTRRKTIPRFQKDDFDLPKGVRIKKSIGLDD